MPAREVLSVVIRRRRIQSPIIDDLLKQAVAPHLIEAALHFFSFCGT